jgi:Protein of unknown function (DUF3224)
VATHVEGNFENKGWDEETVSEFDGTKITRAHVQQTFAGGIAGDADIDWQMYYRPDGTASFVGLAKITGTVDGRDGTLVVTSNGEFDGKEVHGDWVVVGATGTIEGLSGTGTFAAPMGPSGTYSFDYEA